MSPTKLKFQLLAIIRHHQAASTYLAGCRDSMRVCTTCNQCCAVYSLHNNYNGKIVKIIQLISQQSIAVKQPRLSSQLVKQSNNYLSISQSSQNN